jgi:predicted RNA-binding protein with PUA-like domain
MQAERPLKTPVTLAQLKADPAFAELPLIRQSRLSVMSISAEHWAAICRLGGLEP